MSYVTVGSTGDGGDQYTGLDRFGRVVGQRYSNSSSGAIDEFQYGYDRNSNVMFKINAVHTAQSELFQYDGLNRLTSFSRGTLAAGNASISGTSSVSQSWNLDVLGNWHSSAINTSGGTTTTTTRTHNGLNQITSVNGTGLGYDFDGNLIQDQTGQSYTYDAWNRVTAISTPAGDSVQYSYDALGRRITESDSATGINTDLYYSNRGQVLNEIGVDASGTATDGLQKTEHYIWTPFYVDQLVARDETTVAGDYSDSATGPRSSTSSDPVSFSLAVRLYAEQDADYNITSLTNSSGAIVERYLYDPYGNVTVLNVDGSVRGDGTAAASSYSWVILDQGKRVNVPTGTVNFNARIYILGLDRFAQQDPTGAMYVNGADLYSFEGGSPAGRVDSTGLAFIGLSAPSPSFIPTDLPAPPIGLGELGPSATPTINGPGGLVDEIGIEGSGELSGTGIFELGGTSSLSELGSATTTLTELATDAAPELLPEVMPAIAAPLVDSGAGALGDLLGYSLAAPATFLLVVLTPPSTGRVKDGEHSEWWYENHMSDDNPQPNKKLNPRPAPQSTAPLPAGPQPSGPQTDAGGSGQQPPTVPPVASGADGGAPLWERIEQAIQNELDSRGDILSDAESLTDLSSPHQVANPDTALGPGQVRYQATSTNDVTGETKDWSVNYDPDTGNFGTIKPASGK